MTMTQNIQQKPLESDKIKNAWRRLGDVRPKAKTSHDLSLKTDEASDLTKEITVTF